MSKSLEEVHASVSTDVQGGGWKRFLAFAGPAYMISVGYMDPGNWATDIAGGSAFGYSLLWVLLMSNLIALLLQSHCARLGIVSGKDLAQASRESYPPFINFFLYVLAELAIAACDLAEVIGMAIGIHLLFPSVSILAGVCITVLDSFLLLFLLNKGIKKLEAFIISLVALIGLSFLIQLCIAKPDLVEVTKGFVPGLANSDALYIAIGIIGATVMPHNLYLHSSLVQTRKFPRTESGIKRALRFNIIDSGIALNLALFVNAAILILSAATFFKQGHTGVSDIQDAHRLLEPMLGSTLAPVLFALALIAAGQSSTVTGTLAGQVVMEGYLNLRLQPWIRRLLTRLIAIVPAFITIWVMGEESTGKLLILSQVVLSLQLGFAVIPLIHFVSDPRKMGDFVIPVWQKLASWVSVTVIVALNAMMVYNEISELISTSGSPLLMSFLIIPLCLLSVLVMLYIVIVPFINKRLSRYAHSIHQELQPIVPEHDAPLRKIGVTVDFSSSDNKAISKAIQMKAPGTVVLLIHVSESANAVVYGDNASDMEREEDFVKLRQYEEQLSTMGIKVETAMGFGNPKLEIPRLIKNQQCDLLVMGRHGHKTFKDLLLGATIDAVRHQIEIPLMLV
ncbi:MAG: Nramp family divalent metal transporter [Sediminibacterium sp.]|nr:Nramp family divalent metal transporter [Sediminibacterium sp.]